MFIKGFWEISYDSSEDYPVKLEIMDLNGAGSLMNMIRRSKSSGAFYATSIKDDTAHGAPKALTYCFVSEGKGFVQIGVGDNITHACSDAVTQDCYDNANELVYPRSYAAFDSEGAAQTETTGISNFNGYSTANNNRKCWLGTSSFESWVSALT